MINPAVEIARILLEFEIECQRKTAAAGDIGQDTPATAATTTPAKRAQQSEHTTRRAAGQKGVVQ